MKETEQRLADANKVLKEYEENCDIVTTTIGKQFEHLYIGDNWVHGICDDIIKEKISF